jgi:uncharacterized RDD family membrane protein YckC
MTSDENDRPHSRSELPNPATAPELFEGVLLRRVVAYIVDLGILIGISFVILLVGLVAGFITFGIGWALLPIVIPVVILGYYAATLGSPMRATVGMAAMDLVLTPTRGRPLDGWRILIHPIVFWITWWIAWPVSLAIALLTPRREMVHDLIAGTLMVRRSPMANHWRRNARSAGVPG